MNWSAGKDPAVIAVACAWPAMAGALTLLGYWSAVHHPLLSSWQHLLGLAWTGIAAGYAFVRFAPKSKPAVVATSITGLLSLALVAALALKGSVRPSGDDRDWLWLECAAFVWAANASLAICQFGSFGSLRRPRSRFRESCSRVGTVAAVAVFALMSFQGMLAFTANDNLPTWARYGLLPAAATLAPWLSVAAVVATTWAFVRSRPIGIGISLLLLAAVSLGAQGDWHSRPVIIARFLLLALGVGILFWVRAEQVPEPS